ncbi:MAG: 4'-phosphopantetheinyl transferase superfamily protein, partial [Bacteriovoracaceae bacterium]
MVNNLFNLDLVREKKNIESYIGVANFQKVENHFNNKASLKSIFHSNEINQFNSFPSEARKKSFFLGRYAAKIGLRKFLSNYELNQFEIKTGVFNRPIPFYHFPTTIFPEVTITHSHDLALAIAYDHEHVIGIDLEHIPQIKAEYILKVINPSEKVIINQVEHIAVLWTIKEALSKALRCGLTVPFELFEIKK